MRPPNGISENKYSNEQDVKNCFCKILISLRLNSLFPQRLFEKAFSVISQALAHSAFVSLFLAISASKLGYIVITSHSILPCRVV
nr:MAG TPA: hypothetical protein [Caudoviricetes sp.]